MCFFPKSPKPGAPPPVALPVKPPRAPDTSAIDARNRQMIQEMRRRGIASTNRQIAGGPKSPQSPGARTILGPAPGTSTGGY